MRLIFVTGAEGSGTTAMRRLLAAPDGCASEAQQFSKSPRPEVRDALMRLVDASGALWDRTSALNPHLSARDAWRAAIAGIQASPAFDDVSHIVLKRSSPFGVPHGVGQPDFGDLADWGADRRSIIMYREPCAAVYSTLRRGFDTDVRRLAVMCSEHLTLLAAQVAALDRESVAVLPYRELYERPQAALRAAAVFCGLPAAQIFAAADRERPFIRADERYREELPSDQAAWLEGYFHPMRRRQWRVLEQRFLEIERI